MRICKRWKDAAMDPMIWRHATAFISQAATSCRDMQSWVDSLTQKGISRFSFHKNCSGELIVRFCEIASSMVKYLEINESHCLTGTDFLKIVSTCPNIEELFVSSCSCIATFSDLLLSSNSRIGDMLPRLRKIDIGHTNSVNISHYPISFLGGLENSPLQYLGLSGIILRTSVNEKKLYDLLNLFRNLKGLDLSFTDLSETFLSDLGDDLILYSLDELNLSGCLNLKNVCLQRILKKHCHLKILIVQQVKEISYENFIGLAAPSCIESVTFGNGLRSSKLAFSKNKLESTIKAGFTHLSELSFSDCQISEDLINAFCESDAGKHIKVLQVSSCGVSDKCLWIIFSSLVNLKKLDISRNYYVTDAGLLGFAENGDGRKKDDDDDDDQLLSEISKNRRSLSALTKLEELSMMYLRNISDKSMNVVLELKNLKSLSIKGCKLLTAKALKQISSNLHQLQKLDVGWTSINDDISESLTKNLYFLQILNLSQTNITKKTLDMIIENCNCLRNLDITDCEKITEAAVRDFIKDFKMRLFELKSSANIVYELNIR